MAIDSERLQRLVDENRFDELLQVILLRQVAAAWMSYHRRGRSTPTPDYADDSDWWAVDLWMDTRWWEQDEARLREGILSLVNLAESDDDFGILGAGIMEVFVADDESRLAWIEEHAAASAKFRRSLVNVWTFGAEPDEVALRVERAAGTRLARPKDWTGP